MSGQRYVQRVDGAFFDVLSVQTSADFNYSPSQIVALNACGYIDDSLLGNHISGINGVTGTITISGGPGIVVTTSGNLIVITASGDIKPIGVNIDGGGSPPASGVQLTIPIAFNGTIIGWTAVAEDAVGSCTMDIWFRSGSAPPASPSIPTSGDLISASAPVTISGARSAAGDIASVATWTRTVTKWGSMAFNLTSASGMTRLLVQILVLKTS